MPAPFLSRAGAKHEHLRRLVPTGIIQLVRRLGRAIFLLPIFASVYLSRSSAFANAETKRGQDNHQAFTAAKAKAIERIFSWRPPRTLSKAKKEEPRRSGRAARGGKQAATCGSRKPTARGRSVRKMLIFPRAECVRKTHWRWASRADAGQCRAPANNNKITCRLRSGQMDNTTEGGGDGGDDDTRAGNGEAPASLASISTPVPFGGVVP